MKISTEVKMLISIIIAIILISLPIVIIINSVAVKSCDETEVTCWKHVDDETKLLMRKRFNKR